METKDTAAGLSELFREARDLGSIDVLDLARDKVASVPRGRSLVSLRQFLAEFLPTPDRRRGAQTLVDLPSFCDWVNRNKVSASVLFCDPVRTGPVITAVIDYHEQTAIGDGDGEIGDDGRDNVARWLEFSGRFPLVLSPKWQAWAEAEQGPMTVVEFAAFLEERALDLHAPTPTVDLETGKTLDDGLPEDVREFLTRTGGKFGKPADLMTLSRGIDLNVGAKMQERFRTQSGERAIRFEETHEAKQGDNVVVVPDVFLIAIPVFDLSSKLYRLPIRLTYRPHQGQVMWSVTRWRAEETLDAAVRDMAEEARTATSLPLFFGPAPTKREG